MIERAARFRDRPAPGSCQTPAMSGEGQILRTSWFIFRTAPQREEAVRHLLERRGFNALAPRTREFKRQSRSRITAHSEPVFKRYVFVQLSGPQWAQMRSMPFIDPAPLGQGGKPYALFPDDLAFIRSLDVSPIASDKEPVMIEAGSKVRVTRGVMAERSFKVDIVQSGMAIGLMRIFGALRPVKIPLGYLEAA